MTSSVGRQHTALRSVAVRWRTPCIIREALRVQQHDLVAPGVDQALDVELVEVARDHLADRADGVGELMLGELGGQGWHVVSVDLGYHPTYSPAAQPNTPLPVLLEQEV